MQHSLFWLLDHYPATGDSVAAIHETAIEQAKEADRLGYTSLWIAEHHFFPLSTAPNPAILLTAIAQQTSQLRIGPATAVLPPRNPIHVAEDYAMLDSLSGGRLNMGVGSGSQAREFEPFGADFDNRREECSKNLAEIQKRWHAASDGEHGTNSLNVKPIQSPSPPIYKATMDEDSAFQIGLRGDSMLTLIPPTTPDLTGPATRVRAHSKGLSECKSPSKKAESIAMMFAHVAESETKLKATVVPALERLMQALSGAPFEEAEALYIKMRESGVGIFGTPKEVSQQLIQLEELGINHIAFVSRFGGMSKEDSMQSLQHLAPT